MHQGSALHSFIFAVVLDKITKNVKGNILKEFLYANDLVLLGESSPEVEMYSK